MKSSEWLSLSSIRDLPIRFLPSEPWEAQILVLDQSVPTSVLLEPDTLLTQVRDHLAPLAEAGLSILLPKW